jgi:hypothetical protein
LGKREEIRIWKLIKAKEEKGATVSGYIQMASIQNELFPRGAEYIIEGYMEKVADDSTLTKKMDAGMVYRVYRDTDAKNTPFIIRNSERFDVTGKQEDTGVTAYFTFHVNPRNISVAKSKLITKIRTRGGFEFQHWGPDITTIAFAGTTGNITPIPSQQAQNITDVPDPDVDNSKAYKVFKDFEILYEEDQMQQEMGLVTMLGLQYRGNIYVGHLRNFRFEETAEKPFQFEYAVEFAVEYEATSVSRAQQEIQQNIIRNADTLKYLRQLAEGERRND